MANIGNELRSYFRDRGVTQQSIANDLQVSNAYINAILTGKKSIGKSTARKISELYGISQSWLLTGEGSIINGDGNGIPEYETYRVPRCRLDAILGTPHMGYNSARNRRSERDNIKSSRSQHEHSYRYIH